MLKKCYRIKGYMTANINHHALNTEGQYVGCVIVHYVIYALI